MSSTKKNWKYAGKIALGGLAGGCVGLYFSFLGNHSSLQLFDFQATIITTLFTILLIIGIGIVMKLQLSQAKNYKHLSEEDEVLGDHYDTLFNRKFFNASVLSHLSTFVALANIILVTTFKFANNHWEVSVIPFLISSIFSVMYKIYLPKLDSRLPNPNDEQYGDKMMKAMDEGERYVTFSAIFKLFQYNLLALTILILVLAFYSAITGHTQSLALTLLFILFVFNVSFYYIKIYKYYKSK
ncbi:DUF3169 family protein [Staphylococcus simulans]|uniref:DUF3169 family protein n=2 Tax=Staphylococcus TaxID=1279 RepID=A0A6N2ZN79_STASI|nr:MULTISPECIES: DUF3169 family protein [Staphylococcus]MBO0386733.1 DUF3169 family protein [Staphylococcus simulans]MBU6942846.1 DUF3169 family protein [Staphylococcus sp. CWZ226]MDQ7116095.1 DUF3169 family protein [Staphylococcus simulans]MDQ7139504.1 DUF3169 family protein [Staphylococcus simulans]MDU0420861.1 DUF3169 family protein [Staphylococcus simulans]